ncbi:transposase, partial [Corynebacterium diphtheriae]
AGKSGATRPPGSCGPPVCRECGGAASQSPRDRHVNRIERIHAENYSVYGVRKMHQAMARAGWQIGRDQTARLMRAAGLQGVRRGRKPITTRPA